MARSLSGRRWVDRFPTSTSVDALATSFQGNARRFLEALDAAGAHVSIAATYRPPERAYLMHYAFRIAREGLDPRRVPPYPGVEIDWSHLGPTGEVDREASRRAANEMVHAYGIVHRPALVSRHTQRLAVDMNIHWQGTLRIENASGTEVVINTGPTSGNNPTLHAVGATYGLHHQVPRDPPHWSSDGH